MITIKDIAREAGVAPSTVSRVLTNHPRISVETKRKVREIMERLNYHPNIMAQSLVSKTTNTLAILLPRPAEELFQDVFFGELLRGILACSSKYQYDTLLTSTSSIIDEDDLINRLVLGRRVDGIILLSSRLDDALIKRLNEMNFPTVIIGRTDEEHQLLSVDTDNVQASYDATMHLIQLGHKNIGFIGGYSDLTVSIDRLDGYKLAMQKSKLPINPEWLMDSDYLQQSGFRAISQLFNQPNRPTALVVMDDHLAFGILRAMNELGFQCPQDMSIVSFNNIPLAEMASPPISSIDVGTYQLGYTASQLLVKTLTQSSTYQSERIIIPHRLIMRESSLNFLTNS